MTRSENAKRVNQLRFEKKRESVESLVRGLFSETYKIGVGRWNIDKIAKDAGCARSTVIKHLTDMGLHKKILKKNN